MSQYSSHDFYFNYLAMIFIIIIIIIIVIIVNQWVLFLLMIKFYIIFFELILPLYFSKGINSFLFQDLYFLN
jgi:hypothetical protein